MNIKAAVAGLFALNGVVWLPVLVAFAGLLYCSAALYFALTYVWGPALAAITTGVVTLLLAVLLGWLLIWLLSSPKARKVETRAPPPTESALRPYVGDKAAVWVRENPGPVTVAALAAGMLLAVSSTARHAAARALAPVALRGTARVLRDLSDQDR